MTQPHPSAHRSHFRALPSRRLAAVLVALVLGGAAWWGWSTAWPNYRPTLQPGERFGIDVSAHQGHINWDAVAHDHISAAYLKASEGATWRDPTFADNVRGASAAGLKVGAYHFFTLCRSGSEQADNFLSVLNSAAPAPLLPPVVDLEFGGNCAARPPKALLISEIRAFVDKVTQRSGQPVMVYMLDEFSERYALPADLSVQQWVRSLGIRPSNPWAWWQVNNRARVNGVPTAVDLNVIAATGQP